MGKNNFAKAESGPCFFRFQFRPATVGVKVEEPDIARLFAFSAGADPENHFVIGGGFSAAGVGDHRR